MGQLNLVGCEPLPFLDETIAAGYPPQREHANLHPAMDHGGQGLHFCNMLDTFPMVPTETCIFRMYAFLQNTLTSNTTNKTLPVLQQTIFLTAAATRLPCQIHLNYGPLPR